MAQYLQVTLLVLLCVALVSALQVSKQSGVLLRSKSQLVSRRHRLDVNMHFEEALLGNTALGTEAIPRERYVATNRFVVRNNQGPKFEKRWAERKSRLAKLDGFRFFTLLRRIEADGVKYDEDLGNYISLTVWQDKKNFDDWRTGDAFKEAHGGGGITDFVQLLSTALFILKGSPKPAFYDGLLVKKGGYGLDFATDSGWRQIPADGKNFLPVDVFVVQTRLQVDENSIKAFESQIKSKESDQYAGYDGYAGSLYMRRDATKADDGYNYIEMSIWKDKASYDAYKQSATPIDSLAVARSKSPAFYEGKLALNSVLGV